MAMEPERLAPRARRLIEDGDNGLVLSAVTTWEATIKHAIGKLKLPQPLREMFEELLERVQTVPLPVQHRHALRVAELPPHHADPFDRLLIAQAQIERLPIVSADIAFRRYEVEVIRA